VISAFIVEIDISKLVKRLTYLDTQISTAETDLVVVK
jgi:hypothetical protein